MKSYKPVTTLLFTLLLIHLFHMLSAPVLTIKGSPNGDIPEHIHLMYQGNPASTVTVTWQTSTPTVSDTVLYDSISRGGDPSLYSYSATGSSHTYAGASGYIHDVELTNLDSNTTYYFICGGPGNYSEEWTFRTAPQLISDFKFVVGGDSRTGLADRVKVSQAMRQTNPSFVMHGGDFVTDGTNQSQWDAWFTDVNDNWIGDNGLTIPLIPSLGNHEKNATNYYGQFALPPNEQWYYYDWGPTVRVIILNSEASPSQISTDQVNWLESVLASTPGYKWKIVMFHRNMYYAGGHQNATDLQQYWVPVFDKYHVDLVFQGHSHHYHRTKPLKNNSIVASYREGTIYVTSAGWGAPLYAYLEQPYSAYGNATFHFTLVSIYRNGTLHLEAKDVNGYTFDDIWLDNDVKYWNFANGIYFQTAANITQSPLLTNNYLQLIIDAPTGTTSTTEIYCANKVKPHTVSGVASWSYDDNTKILTANVIHSHLATTVMVLFDTLQPDRTSPEIILISPDNNTVHQSGVPIDLSITDTNVLSRVLYNWDGTNNLSLTSPFDTTLPQNDGRHELDVYAQDKTGNWANQTFVFITDDTAPSAEFEGISQNVIIKEKYAITVTPEDTNGIDRVEIFLDGTEVYFASSPPYSWAWDTTTTHDGIHNVTIRVYDIAGNNGEYQFNVKVSNRESRGIIEENLVVGIAIAIGGLLVFTRWVFKRFR